MSHIFQKFVLPPKLKQSWSPFHDVSVKWDWSYKQEMLSVLKVSLSVCSSACNVVVQPIFSLFLSNPTHSQITLVKSRSSWECPRQWDVFLTSLTIQRKHYRPQSISSVCPLLTCLPFVEQISNERPHIVHFSDGNNTTLSALWGTDGVSTWILKIKPQKFERNGCQARNGKGKQISPVFNLKHGPRSNLCSGVGRNKEFLSSIHGRVKLFVKKCV